MQKLGLLTTEFGMAVGVLAAGYELADGVVASPGLTLGSGIALAGIALALAYMAGAYAKHRTEAKKGETK